MSYQQQQINEEFRVAALEADQCVRAIERANPDARLSDHHDECLGRHAVYQFLYARPFLDSRAAMLDELRWFRDAELPAPANAIDANRFGASRYTLIKKLIARFDRPRVHAAA